MTANEFIVPARNWLLALAVYLRDSKDGDTIIVQNEAMRQLAERGKLRTCPEKELIIAIGEGGDTGCLT